MKWNIKDIVIENKIVLAPMAGISNKAFRNIAKEFGVGLIYAEMVSDKALMYGNEKTLSMIKVDDEERPLTMQLFGNDVDSMVYAAKLLDASCNCDIIDINMGCPVNKVVKAGSGSALMRDEDKAVNLVKEVIANVSKPVTVKIRMGWDSHNINCISLAKKLEDVGVSAIAIHGRTRSDMYEGTADWDIIKEVKQAISIPLIGNGDVKTHLDAKRMLEYTGCDAVMIGRAALGNPWMLKQCVDYLEGNEVKEVDVKERFEYAKKHAQSLMELKGEDIAMKEMRGHGAWYIKGLKNSHYYKDKVAKVVTYKEFVDILDSYETELKSA